MHRTRGGEVMVVTPNLGGDPDNVNQLTNLRNSFA